MKTTGNTILVTGGGSGIGMGLAQALHDLGNVVIVAGRTQASLDGASADRTNMHTLVLDAADPASVTAAAATAARDYPALNMVIHSAGIMSRDELATGSLDLALAEKIIDTNLIGTFRVVEAFLPQIMGKPHAMIATVTSGLAFVPLPSAPAYSASKAAVHSYTVALRERLAGQVEVIEIAPPAVQTGLTPGQESCEGYMPLDAYIAETMANFAAQPTPPENLVSNVLPLRHAERDGNVGAVLKMLAHL
jgi:uncharacterized oxidoreductase